MDFNTLVESYPIEQPPKRAPLWPDPIATHNLGGDHWQATRGCCTSISHADRVFDLRIEAGFLVDVSRLPLTLRLFIRPNSQAGLALILYQYLIEQEYVYDQNGQPYRLRRDEVHSMVLGALCSTTKLSKWRWRAVICQLFGLSFIKHYTPNVNPRKVFMETYNEAARAKKRIKQNDRT